MPVNPHQLRLETEALVIGYAMSRLDTNYWRFREVRTWRQAFQEAAQALAVPSSSIKHLRDEFDPVHDNRRRGWHQRPLRPNRQRILEDLKDVSDDALMALVDRILARDKEATAEAIDSMLAITRPAHNVAERLLTGRRAEDYFLAHSDSLISVPRAEIVDRREDACGYDFGVIEWPHIAVEVKGLKPPAGNVQFTDREWSEAKVRQDDYWLVVIGNLEASPCAKVVRNPHRLLKADCSYQVSVVAVWRSRVSVHD